MHIMVLTIVPEKAKSRKSAISPRLCNKKPARTSRGRKAYIVVAKVDPSYLKKHEVALGQYSHVRTCNEEFNGNATRAYCMYSQGADSGYGVI
jgi:hypothetical protein